MATPILNLFPLWQAAFAASKRDGDPSREEAIADCILALPVQDGQDLAAKLLAACAYDPMCLTDERAARLFSDAEAVAAFDHYGDKMVSA